MISSLLLYSNFGLLVLRVVLGLIFVVHGYPKLFKTFGQFAGFLKMLKVPVPKLAAFVVGIVEFVGGILVIAGLLTQWAGLLIAVDMIFAIILVKGKKGLVDGYEFDLMLLAAAFFLLLAGAGSISVDAWLVR